MNRLLVEDDAWESSYVKGDRPRPPESTSHGAVRDNLVRQDTRCFPLAHAGASALTFAANIRKHPGLTLGQAAR